MSVSMLDPVELVLWQQLKLYPHVKRWKIAFSGGVDSKALLIAMARLAELQLISQDITALHVDHGIQTDSHQWLAKCQQDCQRLGIGLSFVQLAMQKRQLGASEANARQLRYQFFESQLEAGDCLLMAHHANDQAETLLFRLARGCGLKGASGIPQHRKFGVGTILRPWLMVERQQIQNYVEKNKLDWVEDPSNVKVEYARNFIRHQVLEPLNQRWPNATLQLGRFAQIATEQFELLSEIAAEDWLTCQSQDHPTLGLEPSFFAVIDLNKWQSLSPLRRKNLLLYLSYRQYGVAPSVKELNEVFKQLSSAQDLKMDLRFAAGRARTYQRKLYLCALSEPCAQFEPLQLDFSHNQFQLSNQLEIKITRMFEQKNPAEVNSFNDKQPQGSSSTKQTKLRLPNLNEVISLRPRKGGEICHPLFRQHSNHLKQIYQELGVPVWQRTWLPLLYYNDKIAAIPGLLVCKNFAASKNEDGIEIGLNLTANHSIQQNDETWDS